MNVPSLRIHIFQFLTLYGIGIWVFAAEEMIYYEIPIPCCPIVAWVLAFNIVGTEPDLDAELLESVSQVLAEEGTVCGVATSFGRIIERLPFVI